jgi:hypothetical protein
MINPGTVPVDDAREDLAVHNVDVFLAAARERGAPLAGPPVRDPEADRDGRYGWDLPMTDGSMVRLLMPGTELIRARDDITAQAPCLYVNGGAWWWKDALGMITSTARWSTSPPSSSPLEDQPSE